MLISNVYLTLAKKLLVVEVLDSLMGYDLGNICGKAER
jgi:hypothetical protein